jgi:hypothetical protein
MSKLDCDLLPFPQTALLDQALGVQVNDVKRQLEMDIDDN